MSNNKATDIDLKKIEILMKLNTLPIQRLEAIAIWEGLIQPNNDNEQTNNESDGAKSTERC